MDIDLDFADRTQVLELIKHVPASIKQDDNTIKKHNTGIYCHDIPINPISGTASLDYLEAEQRGYFKIDFLNVSVYQGIRNEQHLTQLMNQEPIWELLEEPEFSNQLFQLNGYSNILRKMKPKSVEQLAAVIAMIRPAKRHLIGRDWSTVFKEVWNKPNNDEYYYKKSHSISYALLIIVHMNLLCEQLTKGIQTRNQS